MVWDWFNQHAQPLSFFVNLGTLFVWVFYAHLLLMGFRRQRRPRVLINMSCGQNFDSVCLVSNMSQEPIYVQSIIMDLESDGEHYRYAITDFDDFPDSQDYTHARDLTRQGPLQSGNYMKLGTFSDLILQVARAAGLSKDLQQNIGELAIQSCDIYVISVYGPEDGLIGARRRFLIQDNGATLVPEDIDTERLASRRARKLIRKWLYEYL